jgi:2-C-methyl-D-erythritol 2,4-cyclodiphosphate synthase
MNIRTGLGYDVHRLAPNHRLVLGGVDIPFTHGLIGWSDADVLVHAVMDALLGAAGMGDIGVHFPPGDPQYKGISSLILLERVGIMLKTAGWKVGNIDVVIVAEQPKLRPHVEAMCQNMSRALGVNPDQINVKASTSEELGFIGREEGMAAWATALIQK